jgi:Bacterial regulatory proteins, luxR family
VPNHLRLRLLGTDLNGPEIAREPFLSLNTVRTHTKNMHARIGVNNRRAAVRRAEVDLTSRVRRQESGRADVRDSSSPRLPGSFPGGE